MLLCDDLCEGGVHCRQSADNSHESSEVDEGVGSADVTCGEQEERDGQGEEHELQGTAALQGSDEQEQGHDSPQEAEHAHSGSRGSESECIDLHGNECKPEDTIEGECSGSERVSIPVFHDRRVGLY